MSRRRELEHHRDSLAEIRDIMNSMKTLAYMETRKLARFLDAQHAVVRNIEKASADFLSFHPELLPAAHSAQTVFVLLGAQRGFCGDFNHALLNHLDDALQERTHNHNPVLIAVGHRLSVLLEQDERVAASMDNAGVVEEVPSILGRIVHELSSLQEQTRMLNVYGLFHSGEGGIVMRTILPPFQQCLEQAPQHSHPPVLNEPAEQFLPRLADHYLFAVLHEMLYTSLMAENHQRVTHLDGAVKRLEDESAELARRCNALRQEEIIEEIEVILLSAASLGGGSRDVS